MEKEIYETPEIIRKLAKEYKKIIKSDEFLSLQAYIHLADTIHITACGTAYHAGLLLGMMFEQMTGKRARVYIASEFNNPLVKENDLGIVISQSGETTDTLDAMNKLKEFKIPIVAICNVEESTIAKQADILLPVHAGKEISIASTKAFVAQVLVGLTLVSGKADFSGLAKQVEKILMDEENKHIYKNLGMEYKNADRIFFLGTDFDVVTAMESALKVKETSYKHAEGYPAKEFRHGPIAMVDNKTLCVIFDHDNSIKINNTVSSRDSQVYTVPRYNPTPCKTCIAKKPKTPQEKLFNTILNVIPAQLFALHLSQALGIDTDRPRNLTKAVIV